MEGNIRAQLDHSDESGEKRDIQTPRILKSQNGVALPVACKLYMFCANVHLKYRVLTTQYEPCILLIRQVRPSLSILAILKQAHGQGEVINLNNNNNVYYGHPLKWWAQSNVTKLFPQNKHLLTASKSSRTIHPPT
jgi:hypothetical protein